MSEEARILNHFNRLFATAKGLGLSLDISDKDFEVTFPNNNKQVFRDLNSLSGFLSGYAAGKEAASASPTRKVPGRQS